MTTYTFRKITHTAKKRLSCPKCGRTVRRTRTFWQTLNPFNKRADGVVKTAPEIRAELLEEADKWEAEPVVCTACEDAADPIAPNTNDETD